MKVLGNKVYITKGESFTLKFGSRNISPFVITSDVENPFIVVALKSTVHKQIERYISTRWLDCKNVVTFTESRILHLGVNNMNDVELPQDEQGCTRVYSVSNDDNELTYFYYDAKDNSRHEYSFSFTVDYTSDESNEFVDMEYIGDVWFTSGQTMSDYLRKLCQDYDLDVNDTSTIIDYFNALSNIHAIELDNILSNFVLQDEDDVMMLQPIYARASTLFLYKFKLFVEV